MTGTGPRRRIPLDPGPDLWERFFLVSPLALIGTLEYDGSHDFAPKHLLMPLSWEAHFGFVCTPAHGTYRNVRREGWFTVSVPRPEQVVMTSLAAAPRCYDHSKPALSALPTVPATRVGGVLLQDALLHLECELDRFVDGFGRNSLVAGRILAASVAEDAARGPDVDDDDLITRAPLLAYLYPGRFATIDDSRAFPFHAGTSR